jgi:hypothetical protein
MLFRLLAVVALLLLSLPLGGSAFGTPPVEHVCEVMGVVSGLKDIQRSPYADGAPTLMAENFERSISISVNERRPHYKNTDQGLCKALTGEVRTYKLCSRTPVAKGDRIHATEGAATGSASRCLFDLVVINPPGQKI